MAVDTGASVWSPWLTGESYLIEDTIVRSSRTGTPGGTPHCSRGTDQMSTEAGRALAKQRIGGRTPSGRIRTERMIRKNAAVRTLLLDSAAKVIGRYGYAGCSIARVTAKAKVAHGTFYLHFKSQQHLFDEVVPWIVRSLRAAIGPATHGASSMLELERRGVKANFDFLKKHPYLHRAFYEAEIYSRQAYESYFDEINKRYSHALQRLIGKNAPLTESDRLRYDAAAAMLEGARVRMMMRYGMKSQKFVGVCDEAIDVYLRFVVGGINALFEDKLAGIDGATKARAGKS
jgi:AcrR family transcriptional regulator